MKTMQNFAAQQLSKKQMNNVKGGTDTIVLHACTIKYKNSTSTTIIQEKEMSILIEQAREGGALSVHCEQI